MTSPQISPESASESMGPLESLVVMPKTHEEYLERKANILKILKDYHWPVREGASFDNYASEHSLEQAMELIRAEFGAIRDYEKEFGRKRQQ